MLVSSLLPTQMVLGTPPDTNTQMVTQVPQGQGVGDAWYASAWALEWVPPELGTGSCILGWN